MIILLTLVVTTGLLRGLGALGVGTFASWVDAARVGVAVMLLVTASAHFKLRVPMQLLFVGVAFWTTLKPELAL